MPSGTHLRFAVETWIGVAPSTWEAFLWRNFFDYLADEPVDYEAAAEVVYDHLTAPWESLVRIEVGLRRLWVYHPSQSGPDAGDVLYEPTAAWGNLFAASPDGFWPYELGYGFERSWNRTIPSGRGNFIIGPTMNSFLSSYSEGLVDVENDSLAAFADAVAAPVTVGVTQLTPIMYQADSEAVHPITQVRPLPRIGRRKRRRQFAPIP